MLHYGALELGGTQCYCDDVWRHVLTSICVAQLYCQISSPVKMTPNKLQMNCVWLCFRSSRIEIPNTSGQQSPTASFTFMSMFRDYVSCKSKLSRGVILYVPSCLFASYQQSNQWYNISCGIASPSFWLICMMLLINFRVVHKDQAPHTIGIERRNAIS